MSSEKFTHHKIEQVKSDGTVKERDIHVPSDEVRKQHARMLHLLYGLNIPMPHATGSVPNKTILDNVLPHQQNDHFYILDMENAYKNVDKDYLLGLIKSPLIPRAHESEVHEFITEWATDDAIDGLPFGAPASPYLFNLYCLELDKRLMQIPWLATSAYTRYLDDLTFSDSAQFGKRIRRRIRDTINDHPGMSVNVNKTRRHTLGAGAVTITGVSIYPDANRRLGPAPSILDRAQRAFDDAYKYVEAGQMMFESDIMVLQGYISVLQEFSTQETPHLAELLAYGKFLVNKAKALQA